MTDVQVVGLGALNMDYIYQVESILGDEETADPYKYREAEQKPLGKFPGGSAANTIYGLARLGIKTGFVGVIGDDEDGGLLLKDFRKVGVDTSQISMKPRAKTGLARCLVDKLNFRSIQVTPGANSLLTIDDIDLDYINQAEILHISSFVDSAQLEVLLELVNKLDSSVKVSFSPGELYAVRGLGPLAPILARTHVLFANKKEVEQLTGRDFKKGAEVCLQYGCHIVAVTLGRGAKLETMMATSYVRDASNEYIIEPGDNRVMAILDTTGAGDAFAAGFLYGLVNEKPLNECGRLGDIVARFSITKTGARQGLPTLKELSRRYREIYQKKL